MVSHPSINKLIINNISNSFKIFVTCANDGKKSGFCLSWTYSIFKRYNIFENMNYMSIELT